MSIHNKETSFERLLRLKVEMKAFSKKEEKLRQQMNIESNNKKFKILQKELDNHLSSFKKIEAALVEEEKKMINLDRGLYKGIAINVRDKSYKKIPLYFKYANINNHVGYTGTTRVGKTKNMIADMQQLVKKGWDIIIIDPKGGEGQEILTETIQTALKANRAEDFKFLSPAFPDESEFVNLLYGMEDDEVASMIKTFAESVSDDGFFTGVVYENTLAVAKSLTFIQAATDPMNEYTKSLEQNEIRKYNNLKEEDINKNDTSKNEIRVLIKKEIKQSEIIHNSLYQNRSMITFKVLSNYTTFKSIKALRDIITLIITIPPIENIGEERFLEILQYKNEALSILDKVLSTDEANFSKISKTHSVLLSQLVYGDIGKVFSGIGVNPISNRFLSDDKGLICVMQPYPMKYKTVSNISVMALLKSIESIMGLVGTSGRANKRKLVIMIDEAGSVMYKGIEELFNKAAGLGATLFVYTQSYEDYNLSIGPTNANVVMDNVNTVITMKMNHPDSCKRAAESLGTIRKHQSMYMATGAASAGASGRFSVGNQDEEIALPEDINELAVGMGYIRHNGETYLVDFPYVKGLPIYPIKMPVLENERLRRELSIYELKTLEISSENNHMDDPNE